MNNILKKFMALTLVVMAITAFTGCDNSDSSSQTETTVAPTTVAPTTIDPSSDINTDLNNLHSYDIENGDELAGVWKITGGEGEQFESFVYMFDGNGRATLALGNMGYLADYTLDENEKTLKVQLVFGLNGTYSYKISDDKKSVELTNSENNSTTVIEKVDEFSMLPTPDVNPQLDDKLIGAWLSENGEYLYFDQGGIMYQNLYGMTIIYSSYNAVNGVITSKYSMQNEELTDTYKYSVKDNILTLNDVYYERIPASDLI